MKPSKLRQQLAREAACLIRQRPELRHSDASQLAVERFGSIGVRPSDMPAATEIAYFLQAIVKSEKEQRWEHRFERYLELLQPLGNVKQDPLRHPEGDALYHSLQVFDLVSERTSYDEELLTAALLHDVGKAIDRSDHFAAALAVLTGIITPRTAWLIENLSPALDLADGTLGIRARRRLESSENFDELQVLAECDRAGRVRGRLVPEVEEALEQLRELSAAHDND